MDMHDDSCYENTFASVSTHSSDTFDPIDNVMTITTSQTPIMTKLMSVLKDIFVEGTFSFREDGIHFTQMDNAKTILLDMFLPADNFETYECKKTEIRIEVNMANLSRTIQAANVGDVLTIYMTKEHYSDGAPIALAMRFENKEKRQCQNMVISVMDGSSDVYTLPPTEYTSVTSMPTADFQKTIQTASGISDEIEIKAVGHDIIFSARSDNARMDVFRTVSSDTTEGVISKKHTPNSIVQGVYTVKGIKKFTQCTQMCTRCEMHLKNDSAIMFTYSVGTLGKLNFAHIPLPPPKK